MNHGAQGRTGKKGFTIVEAMIAVMIMALSIGGAYALMVQLIKMSREARDHYVAVNICKNQLELARNFQYSDLTYMAEDHLVVDDNGNPNTLGNFRRTTAINTNYATGVSQMAVTCEIRSGTTGNWQSSEQVASLFTTY